MRVLMAYPNFVTELMSQIWKPLKVMKFLENLSRRSRRAREIFESHPMEKEARLHKVSQLEGHVGDSVWGRYSLF